VQATMSELSSGREVQVDNAMLERGARLYQTFRAIIRANGYSSIAIRCWPEFNEPFIGISTCLATGLLLGKGEVTAAGCEADWPMAVAQTMGTLLSGQPAACLDWVNDVGASEVVQLGHCGAGICGKMACGRDMIAPHPVLRQIGQTQGPVHIGQFQHGPKTGLCLLHDSGGKFKLLVFRGESGPDTDLGMCYSAADVRVKNPHKLHRLILDHGFPHHLALAFGDIFEETRILCQFLGVEFISPEAEDARP
jgi:L-fucose isomerase-like protein